MSDHSKIQWTDSTWPVVTGCTKVSAGCRNCYAIKDAWRLSHNPNTKVCSVYAGTVEKKGGVLWPAKYDWTGLVKTHHDRLDWPLKWKKPRKIFVCNESDLFHEEVPAHFQILVLDIIKRCPQHVFQLLTKRPERMLEFFLYLQPPRNVWAGVSVEDRKALHRLDLLRQTPAAVRFLSLEPLLEDLGSLDLTGIQWVIVGGESGPGARPCHMDWVRLIRDQCKGTGVRFFFKQAGGNVRDRNDVGFDGDWNDDEFFAQSWPEGTETEDDPNGFREEYQGAPVRVCLKDKKGGDMSEWPADLRVRELP